MFKLVQDVMAPLNGFGNSEVDATKYLSSCNAPSSARCRRPVLELSTFNDMLISPQAIWDVHRLHNDSPHVITCTTRGGTHVVRWEGWFARCWLSKVSGEFLVAALDASKDS